MIFPGSVVGIMLRRKVVGDSLSVREHPLNTTIRTARTDHGMAPFGRIAGPFVTLIACPSRSSTLLDHTQQMGYAVRCLACAHAPLVTSRQHPANARNSRAGRKFAGLLKHLDDMGISLSGQRWQVGLTEAICPWTVESTYEAA